MNATQQASWIFITLLLLAWSGFYFARSIPVVKLDAHTLHTTPDMDITDVTVHQFDMTGHQAHYLMTPLMRHTPMNNAHWFKQPTIIMTPVDQPAWDIRSHQATSLYGGEQITFNEHVVIHQGQDAHTQESTLKTEEMVYFPKKKIATSSLKVTFEQPGKQVQATGMKAYLTEKRIQLLSRARGSYAPTHG